MNKSRTTLLSTEDDYRNSHRERGGVYDATLAATPFDAYMAKLERERLVRIVPHLFSNTRPRYLDFACGTGRITSTVAPFCADSIGIDVSASMLTEARMKCPTVNFIEADLTSSEIDIGTFDLATSFRFLGNAQPELRVAALRALHRVLRPNAYLIVNSHRNPQSIAALLNAATGGDNQGMDLHYFKLRRMLRSCGFEIIQSYPIGVWLYRHKLMQNVSMEETHCRRKESLFRSQVFAPIAPDVVVLARKMN